MMHVTVMPAHVTAVEIVIVCVQRLLPIVMSAVSKACQSNGEHRRFVVSITISIILD